MFVYPLLSGERKVEQRRASVTRAEPAARATGADAAEVAPRAGRGDAEGARRQGKKAEEPAAARCKIAQAGLSWSKRQFLMISAGLGAVRFRRRCSSSVGSLLPALGVGFAAGFGLPRWLLSFLKKRREKKFLNNFPDAVDVIVRGIKAGLPLRDCLRIIANEAQEPVKSEFKAIVETQTIGMPIGEACAKLYERMPLPEANFFGIVISIQQKAGGNLSEALGNLSRVLRDRKKMKAKIQAMSMEAKASAVIIGALPICVVHARLPHQPGLHRAALDRPTSAAS